MVAIRYISSFLLYICFTILLSITFYSCLPGKQFSDWDKKTIEAVYSGGHKWDITLSLYRDSTFRYVIKDDMMGIPKVRTGAYLKTDTSIELYTWKRKYISKKSNAETFRLINNNLLMFHKDKEMSPDSSFYRAYYTLSLDK
jgi:hypothetical protein